MSLEVEYPICRLEIKIGTITHEMGFILKYVHRKMLKPFWEKKKKQKTKQQQQQNQKHPKNTHLTVHSLLGSVLSSISVPCTSTA